MTELPADPLVSYALDAAAADVADLATFPDWFLAAFNPDDLAPQALFAAYLLRARRREPSLHPAEALERFRQEAPEALGQLATAFALSCSLERLKRAGLLESYTAADPFSLDDSNCCTFPAGDAAFYRVAASADQLRRYVRSRLEQANSSSRQRSHETDSVVPDHPESARSCWKDWC